jgi:hypothetical protein
MKKSILFVCPDYHCSFFYRDELRKLGWKADIFVPAGYPELMLYSAPDYICRVPAGPLLLRQIYQALWSIKFFFLVAVRYKYHFYYCGLDHLVFGETKLPFMKRLAPSFRLHLMFSKLFGVKIIHLPSGVPDEEMPDIVEKFGNLEEGVATEDPVRMRRWFDVLRRYADMHIGYGLLDSSQYRATHIKYKAINLDLWKPDIEIPKKYLLPPTHKLRILHSFMYGKGRVEAYKGNIKGTKYIEAAIDQLISEGYEIEYLYHDNVPANAFRFIQVQADIVVEEIVRGGWGSTAVECMALGKPVISYVRPEWEAFYYECFPDANPLPIVNANKHNIYDRLKKLVTDSEYRQIKGIESRRFAINHLNPATNAYLFTKVLEKL